MKHCPECNRDYADPTLSYCLEDGSALLFGAAVGEARTAILSGHLRSEAPTSSLGAHPERAKEFEARNTEGLKLGGKKLLLISGVFVVALLLALYFGFRHTSLTNAKPIDSVAVLPFENGSGDPNLDYLSDGVSETLIDKLSILPQLKVIARSSSFKYRGNGVDLRDVAGKLGVRAIVTGRIARVGDDLTVRVEMVDAMEDRQLWSEQYNRKFSDLLSIQQDIAQKASETLRLRLSGDQQQQLARGGTVNSQANDLVLQGRYVLRQGGTDSWKRSLEYMRDAVAVDPNYALAHAELANAYFFLATNSITDPKEDLPKAEVAVRKALDLDPSLPAAHFVFARLLCARWQWEDSAREYKRAIELDPNSARAHLYYIELLNSLGKHQEAVAEAGRAKELDPLSTVPDLALALSYYYARRFDESIAQAKSLDPDSSSAPLIIGFGYVGKGSFKEAFKEFERSIKLGNKSTSAKVWLGAAAALSGEAGNARAILKELETSKEYVSPAEMAILYAALGDKEAAFPALRRGFDEHDPQLQWLKVEPGYDPLRGDERFTQLLNAVRLQQ